MAKINHKKESKTGYVISESLKDFRKHNSLNEQKTVNEDYDNEIDTNIDIEYKGNSKDTIGEKRANGLKFWPCEPITVENVEGVVHDENEMSLIVTFSNGDKIYYSTTFEGIKAEFNNKPLGEEEKEDIMNYIQGAKGSVLAGILNWYEINYEEYK